MADYQIETDVPIPVARRRDGRTYPFKELEVGQSFLVPLDPSETPGQLRERVSAAMTWAKRKCEQDYCTRKVDGGIRVWRIT